VPEYREFLANHHNNLGAVLAGLVKHKEAEVEYRAALAIRKKLVDDFPNNFNYREYLANHHHHNLGRVLVARKRYAKAQAEYREALVIRKRLADLFPAVPGHRSRLANTHAELGYLLLSRPEPAEAGREYRRSVALLEQLTADSPLSNYQLSLGSTCCNLGHCVRHKGVPADVLPWYDRAIRTLAPLVERKLHLPTSREYLRNTHVSRASLRMELGKVEDAIRDWTGGIELAGDQDKKFLCELHRQRALALMKLGKFEDATRDWTRGIELTGDQDKKLLCELHRQRALALMKRGRFPDAIKDWDRAIDLDEGPERALIRTMRAKCWVRVDPKKALDEAKALLGDSLSPEVIYSVACVYAMCAGRTKDAGAKERYAARAVALLQKAREQGFFKDLTYVTRMKKHDAMEPLRDRADFRKLLAELEAGRK